MCKTKRETMLKDDQCEKESKSAKPTTKLVCLLYLIPLVDISILSLFLAIKYSNNDLILSCLRSVSLVAATSTSVSASLLFYKDLKDGENVEFTKIITLAFSLAIHIVVEIIMIITDQFNLTIGIISTILLLFSIFISVFVIKNYINIDEHRKNKEKTADANPLGEQEMEQISNSTRVSSGNDDYNVEG